MEENRENIIFFFFVDIDEDMAYYLMKNGV